MAQRVPGRSKVEILDFANKVREKCGVGNATYINIVNFLESLPRLFSPDFVLEIVEDHELVEGEAVTYPDEMRIVVRQSTYDDAFYNQGRSRFTIAHEMGHLFLHRDIPAAYTRSVSGGIKIYEDPEWQADVFAGEFLAPMHQVLGKSVECVVSEYKISRKAAEIQLDVASKELIKKKALDLEAPTSKPRDSR